MNFSAGRVATLDLVSGRFFVVKVTAPFSQLAQAIVGEGDAKDVRGEILEGGEAGADRQAVNHPVFFPDCAARLGQTGRPVSERHETWRGRACRAAAQGPESL